MKTVPRKPAVHGLLERTFPTNGMHQIILESDTDHTAVVRTFVKLLKRSRRDDLFLLPSGLYPSPDLSKAHAIRALSAGSVQFVGRPGTPPVVLSADVPVWLSGVALKSPSPDVSALVVTRGTLFLTDCRIEGGIEISGRDTRVYMHGCLIGSAPTALDVSKGAELEMTSCSVTGCEVGVTATEGAKLVVMHCKIESATRTDSTNPGAGIHGENASVYVAGNILSENQVGVHLVNCGPTEVSFCRFERNLISGLMASGTGPLDVYGCAFREQAGSAYGHIALESIDASIAYCSMDSSAEFCSESGSANVRRIDPELNGHSDTAGSGPFADVFKELRSMVGHDEIKPELENLLRQAHASAEREEQGLPVLHTTYHMVFEGGEGSGRREVAALVAKALGSLRFLRRAEVVEVLMEDILLGSRSVADAVAEASGSVLLLLAPVELDRRDPRLSFTRAREVLQETLAGCGTDTLLIFAGEREFVRPIVRSTADSNRLFHAILRFPQPNAPELAQIFRALCHSHRIEMTHAAEEKILLMLHMLDDRRDRRFLSVAGVGKLFEITHKRYLERCSRERRFDLPLEGEDIDSPIERAVDTALATKPAFVRICPACSAETPWMPGLPESAPCPACHTHFPGGWGIWAQSSLYRRLINKEEPPANTGLPSLRRKAAGAF